jgi:uncharacterized membrane protein
MSDSHWRSVLKGVTWRVTGTMDTIVLSYLITGTLLSSIKIGFTEVFTKIGLYYLHERLWNIISFGRIHGVGPTPARSLAKGISWRIVGTVDTILISYFITGQWFAAVKIGLFEVITKVTLYYLHERIWGRVKWGRILKKSSPANQPSLNTVPVLVPVEERPLKKEEEVTL